MNWSASFGPWRGTTILQRSGVWAAIVALLLNLVLAAAANAQQPGEPIFRVAQAKAVKGAKGTNPFPRRVPVKEFPKDAEWINSGPLTLKELKGKFVLLDFWTYCCINCMHILPELKKLEERYPNQLVVIGVHSAKFETEKDTESIREAVLRYEIEHPVINDADHKIWDTVGVSSWPTAILIDPEGQAVWGHSGEFKATEIQAVLDRAIPYYRNAGELNEEPIKFALESEKAPVTQLRFPGKVLADGEGQRLFISDSNHNRIVVTSLDGKLIDTIGSGEMGRDDGSYHDATFDHPQGCALVGDTLYVADNENHLIRKVDLKSKQVLTIAGTGQQARNPWPGLNEANPLAPYPNRYVGPPKTTAISSPWALWVHGKDLYIAMAGPHQIWKMPLDESEIGPYAGNGREDIVDGALLPRKPYGSGFSSFAQPSGLTSDGTVLYVADSEGSSVRSVPFDPKGDVDTVIGSAHLPNGRLFAFGDADGTKRSAKLQHCLDVAYVDGKIYVADTYNNKLKLVDAKTGDTTTVIAKPKTDTEIPLNEPAGLSIAGGKLYIADTNNHIIRVYDLASNEVETLKIAGLTPPANVATKAAAAATSAVKPALGEHTEKVAEALIKPVDGAVQFDVTIAPPAGWKLNPSAPMAYQIDVANPSGTGAVDRAAVGQRQKLRKPAEQFTVRVPVTGEGDDAINVTVNYYYCQIKDSGVCKISSVTFAVPLLVSSTAKTDHLPLQHNIPE